MNMKKMMLIVMMPVPFLLGACGGGVSVADLPNNFTGSFSGNVAGFPATLNLVQTSSTSTDSGSTTVSETVTGSISINTASGLSVTVQNPSCNYSLSLEQGTVISTSVAASGDEVSVSLTESSSGLSGSVLYTGTALEFDETLPGNTEATSFTCPLPSGTATFTR